MQLRYNVRVYATPGQQVELARAFGCARVVFNDRRDWQHKLSTTLIRENQAVYVEDLCVVGLGRTRLAKSVHDAGWASFTAMLEYRAARYGRIFGRVNRFFPSTRMCSDCGRINEKMMLNVRAWDCPCGAAHDRDVNAAINVLAAGQADNSNDRGAQVRPGLVPAPRSEAVTHPDAARSTCSVEGISVLQGGEDVNTSPTRTITIGWHSGSDERGPGGTPAADAADPRGATRPRPSAGVRVDVAPRRRQATESLPNRPAQRRGLSPDA
ncbi:RNA-guided endonuclease TnpB family protein [Micromonospora marina]|uniref:RNA-guided endonuclease TnpB family protein n=1 Tax=Micromonospora marina TaxID=307120 RepID=UPI003454FE1D